MSKIYYRQRACDSHPWKCLSPGESASYTWEEPMKAKKLSVRVGVGEWIEGESRMSRLSKQNSTVSTEGRARKNRKPLFSFHFIENEEQGHFGATKTIKLEEIGYMDNLPCPARGDHIHGPPSNTKESSLLCQVDTEGATRVLIVSDEVISNEVTGARVNDGTLIHCNLVNIRKEISDEETRQAKINILNIAMSPTKIDQVDNPRDGTEDLSGDVPPAPLYSIDETLSNTLRSLEDSDTIEYELQDLLDYDEGLFITKRHQVVVEVLEATGLRSSDLNGLSNPYVKVGLNSSNKKRRTNSFRRKASRNTYYVEKSLSPQWCYQSFVFDVPVKAISDPRETRRYSIQCVIKSTEKLGKDKFLGQGKTTNESNVNIILD